MRLSIILLSIFRTYILKKKEIKTTDPKKKKNKGISGDNENCDIESNNDNDINTINDSKNSNNEVNENSNIDNENITKKLMEIRLKNNNNENITNTTTDNNKNNTNAHNHKKTTIIQPFLFLILQSKNIPQAKGTQILDFGF